MCCRAGGLNCTARRATVEAEVFPMLQRKIAFGSAVAVINVAVGIGALLLGGCEGPTGGHTACAAGTTASTGQAGTTASGAAGVSASGAAGTGSAGSTG